MRGRGRGALVCVRWQQGWGRAGNHRPPPPPLSPAVILANALRRAPCLLSGWRPWVEPLGRRQRSLTLQACCQTNLGPLCVPLRPSEPPPSLRGRLGGRAGLQRHKGSSAGQGSFKGAPTRGSHRWGRHERGSSQGGVKQSGQWEGAQEPGATWGVSQRQVGLAGQVWED